MSQPNPTREIFLNFSTGMQVAFYIVAALASIVFLHGFYRRYKKYRRGRSENRFDDLGGRIWRAVVKTASNTTVRKGDRFAGAAHSMIFWGFALLFIGTCLVAIDHDFLRFFGVKILQGTFYLWFSLVLDVAGVVFIVGLILMMVRRAAFKLPQLDYARADAQDGKVDRSGYATDDMIFVWILLVIAITGYLIEGFRIGQTMPAFEKWSPVGWAFAGMVNGMSTDGLVNAHVWSWWIHAVFVLFFIAYIPYSKMMHIFTDAANLVFMDENAGRKLPGLPPGKDRGDGKKPVPSMHSSRTITGTDVGRKPCSVVITSNA